MKDTFLDLLSVNKGHYALESGLHGDVWFDLEIAFIHPHSLQPFIDRLADILSGYNISAVCGALVGGAFLAYSIAQRLEIDFLYTERDICIVNGVQIVSYRLPSALRSKAVNRRIGVIDDAINAGSAVTKTCDELRSSGAKPVVLASILTVGGQPLKVLSDEYPEVVSLEHLESNLWEPRQCPLCKSGVALIDPYKGNH